MSITYKNTVSAEEVNFLRASVGFRQILPEQLNAGLNGSALVVSAYDKSQIVGMARLIWDGGIVALITDVLVLPEYKMHGIEEEMITQLLDFLRSKLKAGFGIQVDVKAWDNQEKLYENLGFQLSAHERRGVPMHICLTDQIELTDAKFKQCGFSEQNSSDIL
ncbi:MAG: GNAT family N-acetyltransferase [Oscillospiraceae bacterium]|nr:GNAT family N-acetyltransferase [Oscillospiraceae bacterium]